ncbi:MAG TPA: 3-oxoacyl-[acyl-carrier-protein] reductase [Candidatus Kapabacteria bacterium]|nr:3-oxoacyl-[acyl-carrier-protein] reductase [Candidatus Kapabacteria bacterium]HPO61997.1 3-oxoacyl-[acyl-carrier-protein] reductase [Candidatus Kapabacteria bacterium]
MEKKLLNKIAIVTGGCRGIGLAISEELLKNGAYVFALDYVIPENIEFENSNYAAYFKTIQADVSSEESVNAAIEQVLKEKEAIHILVNNAGITRDNLLIKMSEKEWDSVLDTNLKGAFICSKAVAKTMMLQRQGRIVNVSSVVGAMGNAGQSNYSASKAGMMGFTKSLAKELGSRNILVNCIAPGYVRSAMTDALNDEQKKQFLNNIPLKRVAEPSDIANLTMFLVSEESSYITGQVIHINGGLFM